MTQDEAKRLEEVRSEVSTLRRDVSAVQADVAAIRAVTDAIGERRDAEAGALWSKHGDVDARLRTVEVNYATKTDTDKLSTRVTTLEQSLSKMIGWGAAGMFIIQILGLAGLAAILKWAGGAH